MTGLGALHIGPLHPVETLLVLLLAFGPLIAAVAVVIVVRRRDAEEDASEGQEPTSGETDSSAANVPPSS